MTEKGALYENYTEIIQAPLSAGDLNDAQESVVALHQDEWLRILLVRHMEQPEMTIEIESSLPLRAKGEPSMKDSTLHARSLLEGMVRTLQYLLNLEELGFSLDIIGQDCMWTAYKEFTSHPDASFFDAITPP